MRHAFLALPIAAIVTISLPAMAQLPKKPEPKGTTAYSVEGDFSTYKQENSHWGELKGKKGAVAARAEYMSPSAVMIAADGRFAYGKVDYKQADGDKQDHLTELRAVTGRRIGTADSHFTPYLGIGWRHAVSNSGGMTNPFYSLTVDRRTADYYYLPVGILSRRPRAPGSYVELNGEFDYLLRGTTKAEFPQAAWTQRVVHNHGRGYRASAMFGFGAWAVGPFFTHWTIAKSAPESTFGTTEPETKTTEAGVRVRYSFN